MTQHEDNQPSLERFFAANHKTITQYMLQLGRMIDRGRSFPRILSFVHEEGQWLIADITPAGAEYLPDGKESIQSLLTSAYRKKYPAVNVFMMVLRKHSRSNDYAYVALLGNSRGERLNCLSYGDGKWHEMEEEHVARVLETEGDEDDLEAPTFEGTLQRLGLLYEKLLPDKVSERESTVLALGSFAAMFPMTHLQLQTVLEENHRAIKALMVSESDRSDVVTSAVERATKAKEKQYTRLFKDYEKVQLQAKGYQQRIQDLQGQLKKVGQLKAVAAPAAEVSRSLAERLDSVL